MNLDNKNNNIIQLNPIGYKYLEIVFRSISVKRYGNAVIDMFVRHHMGCNDRIYHCGILDVKNNMVFHADGESETSFKHTWKLTTFSKFSEALDVYFQCHAFDDKQQRNILKRAYKYTLNNDDARVFFDPVLNNCQHLVNRIAFNNMDNPTHPCQITWCFKVIGKQLIPGLMYIHNTLTSPD